MAAALQHIYCGQLTHVKNLMGNLRGSVKVKIPDKFSVPVGLLAPLNVARPYEAVLFKEPN